jgi:hypothetical protein
MSFQLAGLAPAVFAPLFALSDAELHARGMRRHVADEPDSAPCRVSLIDAAPGETLLLLPYQHVAAPSPYQAAGPIFVREQAREQAVVRGRLPEMFLSRLLSLRAYDAGGVMVDADVMEGTQAQHALPDWLARPGVDHVHLHFARRGCFGARVDRVAASA